MKRIFALAATFAFFFNHAFAAITASDLVQTYQDSGYTRIEVTTGATQFKVEAVKEGQKIEVIYDIETGNILRMETKTLDPSIVVTPGVSIKAGDVDDFNAEDLNDDEGDDDGISGVTNGEGDDDSVSGVTDDESDGENNGNGSNDDESDSDSSGNDTGDDGSEDHGDDQGDDD